MGFSYNKPDRNQDEIVKALAMAGCTVSRIQCANPADRGVPDLLVGFGGFNYVLECKMPVTGRLTVAQEKWHNDWRGKATVVTTPQEALVACGFVLTEEDLNNGESKEQDEQTAEPKRRAGRPRKASNGG